MRRGCDSDLRDAQLAAAVGIAAALVVVLGRQLNRPRLAAIATIAVLATVALLGALRTRGRGAWGVYGSIAVLS